MQHQPAGAGAAPAPAAPPKKEIYTWQAPWPVYSVGLSSHEPFTIAVGSFIEEYSNKIQVISLDAEKSDFVTRATLEHPYPATRLQWAPEGAPRDLLATSGDYLRLWSIGSDGEARQECTLNNVRAGPAGRAARPPPLRAPSPPTHTRTPLPPPSHAGRAEQDQRLLRARDVL